MQKEERQSNFELLRIVSMMMIIFWHIMVHGGVLANPTETLKAVLSLIQSLIFVHVNSFILVTGYFQCESRFKMSKVLQLNNSIWFYKALIPLILIAVGMLTLSKLEILKLLSPISHYDYWFMTQYILLYLISPILNIVINNISKDKYKAMLVLFFVVFSVLPFLTNQEFYPSNMGYTLLQFVILYFIGAYFRKYKIEDCFYLKKFSVRTKRLVFLSGFLIFGILSGTITFLAGKFTGLNSFFNYISQLLINNSNSYNNPFLMVTTIFYFLFFSVIHFKSKFINRVSRLTLGVYLIHENLNIRPRIYDWFGFNRAKYSCAILPKMIVVTLVIFIGCSIIEFIRQSIFRFFYKRKMSKKIRRAYRNYINNSLKVPINW